MPPKWPRVPSVAAEPRCSRTVGMGRLRWWSTIRRAWGWQSPAMGDLGPHPPRKSYAMNPSRNVGQDYLKIATFPTELLSHTPSISVSGFEVMEGMEVEPPKSPGLITSEERGFVPSATTTSAVDNETQPVPDGELPVRHAG